MWIQQVTVSISYYFTASPGWGFHTVSFAGVIRETHLLWSCLSCLRPDSPEPRVILFDELDCTADYYVV